VTPRELRVWDPVVRILHWALAAAVALGWATTEWLVRWHQPVGYAALGIVAARIAWGFVGDGPAGFGAFVRGPAATWRYARLVLRGREPRHIGHNPLGAWMALALLATVVALALTGWLYTTDRLWGDATVEWLHRALAWTIVALVALHVGGVILASRRHRENLVAAMLDGRKRVASDDDVE
jgi:cytochrome b